MSQPSSSHFRARFSAYIMAFGAIFLTISMVLYPDIAFEAAAKGVKVWFEIVFPALLPFFIGAEILMGLGVVHFMGVLLEPFMRPIFNVPGSGSFVMAMGLASGYPIGSVLTGRLRRDGLCTRVEAERLMSFTNTADPLFMFGAVAVGMFGLPQVGITIAISHYVATLIVGLILRFHGRGEDQAPVDGEDRKKGNIVVRALQALYKARVEDGRPFGQLMGDAIRRSVNTLLVVGGFIVLFSVVLQVATTIGFTGFLSFFFARFLALFGMQPTLAEACISGLFEITIGSNLAATAANVTGTGLAPLGQRVAIASGIIAWSGLSVHCQVAAMVNDTDIRMGPFLMARLLHAVFATILALVLFEHGAPVINNMAIPVSLQTTPAPGLGFLAWRARYMGSRVAITLICLSLASATYSILRNTRFIPLIVRKK